MASVLLITGGISGVLLVGNAYALRPFRAASDAAVVEPGTVELELGFDVSRNTRGENDQTKYAIPRAVFNIGIINRFEVDISTGFGLVEDGQKDTTLGSVADTTITFKGLWWEAEEGTPTPSFATEISLVLPTAREEFQPGATRNIGRRVGVTGQVDLTGEVGLLRYIVNLGGGAEPSAQDDDYVGVFTWAAAGELAVTERFDLVYEFQGTVVPDTDDEATALLGLTYTTAGGVKFDFAGFAGLTDGSDNWGITFGLTYDFPIFGNGHQRQDTPAPVK